MSAKWWSSQFQALIPGQKHWKTSRYFQCQCVRTLENTGLQQANNNQEKKDNLKPVGKLCGVVTCSCPRPGMAALVLQQQPGFLVWTLVPGASGQSRPYLHVTLCVYSNLCGATCRSASSICLCLDQLRTQARRAECIVQKSCKAN